MNVSTTYAGYLLFSGPMVRAILDRRKTQTRRVVKPQFVNIDTSLTCPHGQPGERLWVKETWAPCIGGPCSPDNSVLYRATEPDADRLTWRPSIHMPRWASRITLEITAVRVERLQDISEEDAKAEGVGRWFPCSMQWVSNHPISDYKELWNSIHGPGAWDANPWVWVIEFKRL